MRRSKSNPAKYAKNYRSISQRRMIRNQDDDDEAEMNRLRALLSSNNNDDDDDSNDGSNEDSKDRAKVEAPSENPEESILSKEMMEEYGADETPILRSSKKKNRTTAATTTRAAVVTLTPQELKQAAHQRKQAARKLQQLEQRHAQKQNRAALYQKLADSALPSATQQLLTRTASYSKRTTKREALQRSLRKERAGMTLTPEEHDLLYPSRPNSSNKKRNRPDEFSVAEDMAAMDPSVVESKGSNRIHSSSSADSATKQSKITNMESDPEVNNPQAAAAAPPDAVAATATAPSSAAAQLMASLHVLQSKSTEQAEQSAQERERANREKTTELERLLQSKKPIQRYIPTAPIEIKTTQSYEKLGEAPQQPTTNSSSSSSRIRVREIQRPPEVTATRYDLPVAGMEFEIVDAIRNHDVTILCAETGSGKSTQVPQFLYESGFTSAAGTSQDSNNSSSSSSSRTLRIAVTQPRRVAAVSTAKRVCYEMGHGNGRTIPNKLKGQGNVVAYQTRYETAGLGAQTHIKFMTDGILLKEIQSDLLLRQYSCIVLDEAHERKLNTDVLIGLIRGALRLRRQALDEEEDMLSLPPLKVVIMSATLRVQDFTSVFDQPAVVQVPGRMHPVTVHHNRVTELDNYEDEAFRKTCKIHRQLRQGSILVFLTGKQEIVRMVNRLRRALNSDRRGNRNQIVADAAVDLDVEEVDGGMSNNIARDMDDDEADGELFQEQEEQDDFDDAEKEEAMPKALAPVDSEDNDNPLPQKAIVLPLYSLMSTEEQTKVFAQVPEGHRLIVVATNIAETSITIPGVSYVVDSGRQKCRNYNAETGVASFDIMWISKAQADQRAGRAGRTSPGHCYRLYSSSLYSRHMDDFALPEVLTRPLEDVVLAMKAMRISNVADFPFPTAPDKRQLDAAVNLLSNIGCVDVSALEEHGGDGTVTRLGAAVAKLPLGVRYGKMLLVAAQAGVLDYAVVVVAALSEASPFLHHGQTVLEEGPSSCGDGEADEQSDSEDEDASVKKQKRSRWTHSGGDVLAALLAVGAYTYAGRGAGGASEKLAYKTFCEENGLNPVIMERIQKMRRHLARLCKVRLGSAEGTAAKTGGFVCSMLPPNPPQEKLLCQSIASGLLDNVAMLAPVGSIPGEHPFSLRSAYLCCSSTVKEPLFMDRNSVAYSRDPRMLPQWICFDTLIRKKRKDGTSFAVMKSITPLDPSWLGRLAKDSRLLVTGEVLSMPSPAYDSHMDAVMCSIRTKFGCHGWEVPPLEVEMFDALNAHGAKKRSAFLSGDSFRWFARFLFEGKVLPELSDLKDMLTDIPSLITRQIPIAKTELLVSALSNAGIDNAAALRKQWAEVDDKFLFSIMKKWINPDRAVEFRKLWIQVVKHNIRLWKESLNSNQTIASNP